jgi:hypothetical protein
VEENLEVRRNAADKVGEAGLSNAKQGSKGLNSNLK